MHWALNQHYISILNLCHLLRNIEVPEKPTNYAMVSKACMGESRYLEKGAFFNIISQPIFFLFQGGGWSGADTGFGQNSTQVKKSYFFVYSWMWFLCISNVFLCGLKVPPGAPPPGAPTSRGGVMTPGSPLQSAPAADPQFKPCNGS